MNNDCQNAIHGAFPFTFSQLWVCIVYLTINSCKGRVVLIKHVF